MSDQVAESLSDEARFSSEQRIAHQSVPFAANWKRWLLILLLIGIGARCARYVLQFPIWGDESFIALNVLDKNPLELTKGLRFAQTAPILFLWIERVALMMFGTSELALRFFPLLAGIAALLIFYRMTKRCGSPWITTTAVALLAFSYFPLRHSCEVKPYSFDLFFPVALLALAWAWLAHPERSHALWGLMALVPFAILGSYPAVFVAGSISLVLLPSVWKLKSKQIWTAYVGYNLLLGLTFIGNYLLVAKQQYLGQGGGESVCWNMWFVPREPLALLKWLIVVHTGDLFAYPVGGPNYGSTATLLFSILGGVTLWRSGRKQLLGLLTLPFVMTFIAAFLKKYPYGGHARVAQHLAAPICLLMAFGIVTLIQACVRPAIYQRRWALGIFTAMILMGIGFTGKDILRPYKTTGDERCRAMGSELAQRAGPQDRIVFVNPPDQMYPVLEWYIRHHSQPVLWAESVTELKEMKLPRTFWTVQFSTNGRPLTPLGSQMVIRGKRYNKAEEYSRPLLMGASPLAIQHGTVTRWEREDEAPEVVSKRDVH